MASNRSDQRTTSRLLHEAYDRIEPSDSLKDRVSHMLHLATAPSSTNRPDLNARIGQHHHRWLAAAGAVLVIVAGVSIITLTSRNRAVDKIPPAISAATPSLMTSGVELTTLTVPPVAANGCGKPTSPFVPFDFQAIALGSAAPSPTATMQQIDGTQVPFNSIYASGAPLGLGILCLSATEDSRGDIALAAKPGAIGYLGLLLDVPWGAVRPGVDRLTLTSERGTDTYAPGSTVGRNLTDIGDGWRVFNASAGFGAMTASMVTVRAYDTTHRLLDTQTISIPPNGARTSTPPATG